MLGDFQVTANARLNIVSAIHSALLPLKKHVVFIAIGKTRGFIFWRCSLWNTPIWERCCITLCVRIVLSDFRDHQMSFYTTTMCNGHLTVWVSVCNFQSWGEGLNLYLMKFIGINLIYIKLCMRGFLSCFSEVKCFNFQSWKSILLFKLQIEVSSWINFKL